MESAPVDGKDRELSTSPPALASQRTNSSSSIRSTHMSSHRQSFAENLRAMPSSPRNQRHPSFTQAAVQDLLNHPPGPKAHNPRFSGRDWSDVTIGELVSKDDVRWVSLDATVEDATKALLKNHPRNVILVRESASSNAPISTFDYKDLNAYLLAVVGLAHPAEEHVQLYSDISAKAQARTSISLREIQPILKKESVVLLNGEEDLAQAIEVLGSGIHRVLVTNYSGEVVGILSQLQLVEFFWNEGINFRAIDELYPKLMRDLDLGSHQILAINADSPLADALTLMNNEGLSSVAVVDNGNNVVGNISAFDVRLLTNAASLPLLDNSCMHFVSVILTEGGTERGKDAFPVFYVNPYSTLAHTVAKLVATRSHRMWVVESASPSPSAPATPLLEPTQVLVPSASSSTSSSLTTSHLSMPASALPGVHLSGHLTGVVSLTDILNLFAKTSGLHPSDPSEQRARRRRSSSASVRPSIDSARASIDRLDLRR